MYSDHAYIFMRPYLHEGISMYLKFSCRRIPLQHIPEIVPTEIYFCTAVLFHFCVMYVLYLCNESQQIFMTIML